MSYNEAIYEKKQVALLALLADLKNMFDKCIVCEGETVLALAYFPGIGT